MLTRINRLLRNAGLGAVLLSLLTFTVALAAYGGGDWWTSTDFSSGEDIAFGVAVQPNGKIVAVGRSFAPNGDNFALARYNLNGTLDTTFSGDGRQVTNFGGNDGAHDIALQPDGKIIVVGDTCAGDVCNLAMARYLPGGRLDTTFSGDGKVVTDIAGRDNGARGVAIQSDGKIVVIGYSWSATKSDFVFYRYNPNGSRDTTFSGDGTAIGNFGLGRISTGRDLVIQSDGKIVGVGFTKDSTGDNFSLARLSANGTADPTFSADGRVITNFGGNDAASAVALQANGKIVVAGYRSQANFFSFAIGRYNTDGSLDATFNGTGKRSFSVEPGIPSFAYDVMIQPNRQIVVVGRTGGSVIDNNLALTRLNPNGSFDTTFNGSGKLSVDLCGGGGSSDEAFALGRQPLDGRYVLAGSTDCGSLTGRNFAVQLVSP
jgi:uncharacterized delta-60 repeat protein